MQTPHYVNEDSSYTDNENARQELSHFTYKEYQALNKEREMIYQMLEDLKKTLTDLLSHEREIRDSL